MNHSKKNVARWVFAIAWDAFLRRQIGIALGAALLCCTSSTAQSNDPTSTMRVDVSLTLVDVIAEHSKSGLITREPVTELKREDFRIFDNHRNVSIKTFDVGADSTTRPIALWLIVQCDQVFASSIEAQDPGYHSMFMRGKTQFLKPGLTHLGKEDAVGVAHWCDNGDSVIDLPPANDPNAALAKIEDVLRQKPIVGDSRVGELAMQRMIEMILRDAQQTTPSRLPVLLFFYGDGSGTRAQEANSILRDLLETSGLVFGINDGWPFDPDKMFSQSVDWEFSRPFDPDKFFSGIGPQGFSPAHVHYLVHYYSQETGGNVYSTRDPKLFANALEYILTQLHLRYTLGFKPPKLDGCRHTLKVELTKEAKQRFGSVQLRFRPEYIPISK